MYVWSVQSDSVHSFNVWRGCKESVLISECFAAKERLFLGSVCIVSMFSASKLL